MLGKAFFVAATGQNVGKTTTCLGLISGLKKRLGSVGFMKPVGQEHVETAEGIHVDKDVLLFRSQFALADSYEEMSPVLFPRGFTREYLDGKVHTKDLTKKISSSFRSISSRHPLTVCEGTGHMGVGSIVNLNNAQVAALLKCPVILIGSGGLGSSFDELMLNWTLCEKHKVHVAGVILNRVLPDKREMIVGYMEKALKQIKTPLLGVVPYDPFLSMPTMNDFEVLFQTTLLTGDEHRWRHFRHIRLAATSVEMYQNLILPNQLIITPAEREDIILATLTRFWDIKIAHTEEDLETGLILTGKKAPKEHLIDQIRKANIPMLYVPLSSFAAMKMINTSTPKTKKEDIAKIEEAIQVVEENINFDLLLKSLDVG